MSHQELNNLSEQILNNLPIFMEYFGAELVENDNSFGGCCPIHADADNRSAFVMYKNSGTWICNSHHCEITFQKTPIGFIRGLLSRHKNGWRNDSDEDKLFSFRETIVFCQDILNNAANVKQTYSSNEVRYKEFKPLNLDIPTYLQSVSCPSPYFCKRGFDPSVLYKYCVGDYDVPFKLLSGRAIVPIFDDEGISIAAATGRLRYNKCLVCSEYHSDSELCYSENSTKKCKWMHNKGFQKKLFLYNYCFAKHFIAREKTAILAEGPGEIWKLEAAGEHKGLAILGSNISSEQVEKVMKLKPHKIITIMDNDEGGDIARNSCDRAFAGLTIKHLIPSKNDLGEMNSDEIRNLLNEP